MRISEAVVDGFYFVLTGGPNMKRTGMAWMVSVALAGTLGCADGGNADSSAAKAGGKTTAEWLQWAKDRSVGDKGVLPRELIEEKMRQVPPDPSAIGDLFAGLRDHSTERYAILIISRFGEKECKQVVPELVKGLKDPALPVRRMSEKLLPRTPPSTQVAVGDLVDMFGSQSNELQGWAALSLAEHGVAAVPAVPALQARLALVEEQLRGLPAANSSTDQQARPSEQPKKSGAAVRREEYTSEPQGPGESAQVKKTTSYFTAQGGKIPQEDPETEAAVRKADRETRIRVGAGVGDDEERRGQTDTRAMLEQLKQKITSAMHKIQP